MSSRSSSFVRRVLAAAFVISLLALALAAGCTDDDQPADEAPTTSIPEDPGADGAEDDGVADTTDAGPDGSVDQDRPDTDLPPPADG